MENKVKVWSFSSSQYVQRAVMNEEEYLPKEENKHLKIPTNTETPLTMTYCPEPDVSLELGLKEAAHYQSLIGILSWMAELGHVDICLEISMMSSHLALPRKGHLDQVLHILGYLQKYHNTELMYNPSDPVIEESSFTLQDWSSLEFGHVQGNEEKPCNMAEPRGLGFTMRSKVNADHTGDTVTRKSRTGFLSI